MFFLFVSLIISDVEHFFICSLWRSVYVLCPFFIQIACFFDVKLYEFPIYFRYQPFIEYIICEYILPLGRVSFLFFFIVSLLCKNFWFDVVPLFFCFCSPWQRTRMFKKIMLRPMSKSLLPMFVCFLVSHRSFMVSSVIFSSLIYFKFF